MCPLHTAYGDITEITLEKFIEIIRSGKAMPSVKVLVDGQYAFTAIVPNMDGGESIYDDIKLNAATLGLRSNISLPPSVYDVLNKPTMADRMAKARAARRPKVAV